MSFIFEPQSVPDVVLVRRSVYSDDRGRFAEAYNRTAFHKAGITADFVQDNVVFSEKKVLRGLHYQLPPHAQGKLVSVTNGEIVDVAVDLRKGEPTFGKWVSAHLTANGEMLWVPPGFAHGYVVLSDSADVTYKVTSEYAPSADRGIRWNDPGLKITWPVKEPRLSAKDQTLPAFTDIDSPF
jgi:dTDP-4-dehydrorhamnose 3,5-epimerase